VKITFFVKSFALVILIGAAFAVQGQFPQPPDRAKELWELAIAAKGGREALYKVANIADIRKPDGSYVHFVVLPDKFFLFDDMRPSLFGVRIELYNYESGFGYRTFPRDTRKIYQDIRTDPDFKTIKGRHVYLLYPQLYLLLETRWMQPKPLSASKAKVNGKSADRVDVLIEGYGDPQRYAVFLDEKTHLPVRIAMCRNVNTNEITDVCCFSNLRGYTEIAGIKIPLESTGQRDSTWDRKQIEINAEYEPQFFDRLPDHNANGLQWRKPGAKPADPPVAPQPEPLTPTQITQLINDLGATDEELRQVALRDLTTAGKQVLPYLTKALPSSSSNAIQRYNIAVILLKLDEQNPTATAALADLVTDLRLAPQARQDSAFGLLGNEQGIAALIELLGSDDVFVRRFAIFAFDELTERAEIPRQVEKALPALRKLLNDDDKVVRGMAKEVLEQIGGRFNR